MVTAGAETMRSAIVGCGRISGYHAAAIAAVPGVELVAACDLEPQLASELAERAGIPHAFADVETMMREIRPDVVHILTPPQSHVMLAEIAARGGAHLYVEKPFARTVADARRILGAAETAGVRVCAGLSRLFDPWFLDACRRIDSGEIGRVVAVRAEQGFTYDLSARAAVVPWDHTYDWGIFENLIPHPLSVACHFLREVGEPRVAGLNVGEIREAAVEELRVLLPAANAIGEVSLSLTSPEKNRLEVMGTRGRVLVDFDAMTVVTARENGLPTAVNRFGGGFATALKLTRASTSVALRLGTGRIKRYMGIRALVAEFYRSLREGCPPPVSSEDAVLAVRLMEQIRGACAGLAKERRETVHERRSIRGERPVLVTGGSGFLGGRLAERLAERGAAVRATTRLASRARAIPGVEWVRCDLVRDEDVREVLAGVRTVFHCAAMAGPPGSSADHHRANVEATLRIAEHAAESGVQTLVYVSSLSVYGTPNGRGAVIDESFGYDERAAERGHYTQSKLRAEQELLSWAREHELPRVIVIRPGTIYGPGAPVPLGLLRLPSSNRHPIITGGGRVPIALTYVDNVIDAMLAAAERPLPTASIYDVVDDADLDQRELCREIRRSSEARIQPLMVPYAGVWSLMLGVDLLHLVRHGRLGTTRYRLKRTLAPMRFPCTAARRDLAWQPRVSLAEGLARIL